MIIATGYTGLSSVEDLLGGLPDRTLTDHDRGTTVFLRKMSGRKWRYVVKLTERSPSGDLRIGEVIQSGERTTSRRADSLALEIAEKAEPQAREILDKRERERVQRAEESRSRENEMFERDMRMAPSVNAENMRRLQAGGPDRVVGEWRSGDVIDVSPIHPGRGKPVSAMQLAGYTVTASRQALPDVFAICRNHRTAYGTFSQGDARELVSHRARWCPGCLDEGAESPTT
ncbi:hypothetical protein AB0M45_27715 [Nocardia sp. NPDC051787]|uniref:hypothetical protein n=1 Tax=Nocardia sp. NPDC051787 TaxID=3155415 RepID=UPI00342F13CC